MKKTLSIINISLLLAGASQAALVSFSNLNAALATGTNSLSAGGYTTADGELSVVGAASGNDIVYTVTYSGQSYDGDASNDTLSFDVRVKGFSGSTATAPFLSSQADVNSNNGIVTAIGSTSETVNITSNRWAVSDAVMNSGETLSFSIESLSVITSTGTYAATLNSFTGTSYQETGNGYGHIAVIGDVGTDRFATRFNATNYNINNLLSEGDPLYITSAQFDGTVVDPGPPEVIGQPSANPQRWGVSNVDFGINVDVIPEPSSSMMLLGGLGSLLFVRRRSA